MQLRKQLWFAQVPVDQIVVSPGMLWKETTALCVVDRDPSSLSKGSGSRDYTLYMSIDFVVFIIFLWSC